MAVDYRGQPITQQTAFTTTGIMNKKPAKLKPLKMPTQKAVAERVTPDRVEQPKVNLQDFVKTFIPLNKFISVCFCFVFTVY